MALEEMYPPMASPPIPRGFRSAAEAVSADPGPSVPNAIGTLESVVKEVESAWSAMEARLGPALTPGKPVPSNGNGPPSPAYPCDITRGVMMNVETLRVIADRIREAIGRLEI